ncbi:hypothetical protein POM88_022414 [Heracleum sosnowskyi]|uniref:Uncharacterized protein n=1 Tax=Heracleum sosnowskyi TaxID=360622 RepID=A0AAD8MTM5_9APIA|nr:hypothetical protein POM88_022414 [Heracleum sosnowskyi]
MAQALIVVRGCHGVRDVFANRSLPPELLGSAKFQRELKEISGSSKHPLSPSTIISKEAVANIARVEATRSSDSSFQFFLDHQWSRKDFTRETPPDAWKAKKPSRTMSEPLDLSFLNKEPRKLTTVEAEKEIRQLLRKGKESVPSTRRSLYCPGSN